MINKNQIDESIYNHFVLSNGVKVLTVSNSKFDKCSASVSVKIGSNNDPANMEGMAHLLEHTLFLGSKDNLEEGFSMNFMIKHGGYINAWTKQEMTIYFFDIIPNAYDEGLSILSDFFNGPSLEKSYIERAITAVDHEFLNSLYKDEDRLYAMFAHVCKENSIISRNYLGNYTTLKKDRISEKVRKFWETKYSSENMCLVMCGNAEPDVLAQYSKKFENIPKSKHWGVEEKKIVTNIFDEKYFNRLINIKPITNHKKLNIIIEALPGIKLFKTNPYNYIKNIFNSKDETGFSRYLIDEGLITGSEFSFQHYQTFTIVDIKIDLSEKGGINVKYILEYLKKYVKRFPIDKKIYDILKNINHCEFEYLNDSKPLTFARILSESMHYYPTENLLDHDYLYEDFNKELLEKIKKNLANTSKWIIFNVNGEEAFNMKEPYYDIEYSIGDIAFSEDDDCEFITYQNIKLIRNFADKPQLVEKKIDGDAFLYLFNDSYNEPKAYVYCLLNFDNFKERQVELHYLIVKAVDEFYRIYGDMARNNLIDINGYISEKGMEVTIGGFSGKILKLAKLFFDILFKNQNQMRSEIIKEKLEILYNKEKNTTPYMQIFQEFKSMIIPMLFNAPDEKLEMLKKVDKTTEVGACFSVECFICGNIEYEISNEIFNTILTYKKENTVKPSIKKATEMMYEKEAMSENKKNYGCGVFYEIGKSGSYNEVITGRFIIQATKEMFFDQLRTQEELGYIVSGNYINVIDNEFIYYVVQGVKDSDFLKARILKFVSELTDFFLNMDDKCFNEFKEGLIVLCDESQINLKSYSDYIWKILLKGVKDIDYNKIMVEHLKKITKKDIVNNKIFKSPIVVKIKAKE